MHILSGGRAPFLEFLRNLTPQAFLLAVALVAGFRLEPTCCHPENAKQTAIFFVFLAMWLAAGMSSAEMK